MESHRIFWESSGLIQPEALKVGASRLSEVRRATLLKILRERKAALDELAKY